MSENTTINGYSTKLSFGCFVCKQRKSMDFISNYLIEKNNSTVYICAKCASTLDINDYKKKYKSFKEVK